MGEARRGGRGTRWQTVGVGLVGVSAIIAMPASAAGGAYLVDDASITPAGHCQLETWLQRLSGGQSLLTANPACSTGPVEWTVGIASQAHPFQHQEAPAVKWMLRDPDRHPWGLALQANITYTNGHVLTQTTYMAATFGLDAAKRWSLNTEVGELRRRGANWRPLAGVGLEWKMTSTITVLGEHLRSSRGPSVSQAGMRWLRGHDSVDLIVGHNGFPTHDRWITLGWNLAFE